MEWYTAKFYELASLAPQIANYDEELKDMYIEGLRHGVHQMFPAPNECTVTQLYNRAIRVERAKVKPT